MGGKAVANHDSVAEWDGACAMVKAGVDDFGRIDAVVNNAGNLRDMYFHKMGPDDFDAVIAVHLKGSFNTSRAAAPFFKEQGSGAYVHMTSTSGLIGNFGQANYSAAKLGIVGLMQIHRARHAALWRAVQRGCALRLDADDRFHPHRYTRTAKAR